MWHRLLHSPVDHRVNEESRHNVETVSPGSPVPVLSFCYLGSIRDPAKVSKRHDWATVVLSFLSFPPGSLSSPPAFLLMAGGVGKGIQEEKKGNQESRLLTPDYRKVLPVGSITA